MGQEVDKDEGLRLFNMQEVTECLYARGSDLEEWRKILRDTGEKGNNN